MSAPAPHLSAAGETMEPQPNVAPNPRERTGAYDHHPLRTSDRMNDATPNPEAPHYSSRACPNCGAPATAEGQQHQRDEDPPGVATIYYVCDNEHIWSLRWYAGVRD